MFHLQHMLSNTPALLSHGIVTTCRSFGQATQHFGKARKHQVSGELHTFSSLITPVVYCANHFPKVNVMQTLHLITPVSFTASNRAVNAPSYVQPCYAAAPILKHVEGQQILNGINE